MAEGPPSRLVRAPSTELAKQTAEDSAQARCWPKAGVWPQWYGVQVRVGCTPNFSRAAMTWFCLRTKAAG